MTIIQANGLALTRGTRPLFDHIQLSINARDRIGLVGHNGCGKSSLIALLAGLETPEAGELICRRGLRIGMVEQFVPPTLAVTALIDAALGVLDAEARLTERYRAEAMLGELGFVEDQMAMPLSQLSGGQQNLALFARARLTEPDVMLMDEPGNHMDVVALSQLRRYLTETPDLTFVMVSHDRDLLDACCTRTVFLRERRTWSFDLPYSRARSELDLQDEQAQHRRAAEDKEIQRIRTSAKRLAVWGRTYDNEDLARKARTMEKRAEKLAAARTEVTDGNPLDLALTGTGLRTRTVLTLERLDVRADNDGRLLARCEELVIRPGERVALLGANGSGKSTTIRRIMRAHAEPDLHVRFNPNVVPGYFDQDLRDFDTQEGRFDWLRTRWEGPDEAIKRTLLRSGVAYTDFDQPVSTLSGGEKARTLFMLLALTAPNLMVLDEPTNHIDLESREQLEQQLVESGATLLITSHDRRFLETVCDRFLVIEDRQLREAHSLAAYYETFQEPVDHGSSATTLAGSATAPAEAPSREDELLERIQILEDLLTADRARKPKFQKPDRQQAWQRELATLWARLEH